MKWNKLPVILPPKTYRQIWAYSKERGVFLTWPTKFLVEDEPNILFWALGPERPDRDMAGWHRVDILPDKTGDVCVALQSEYQASLGRTGDPRIVYYLADDELFCSCGKEGPVAWRPIPSPPLKQETPKTGRTS